MQGSLVQNLGLKSCPIYSSTNGITKPSGGFNINSTQKEKRKKRMMRLQSQIEIAGD